MIKVILLGSIIWLGFKFKFAVSKFWLAFCMPIFEKLNRKAESVVVSSSDDHSKNAKEHNLNTEEQ